MLNRKFGSAICCCYQELMLKPQSANSTANLIVTLESVCLQSVISLTEAINKSNKHSFKPSMKILNLSPNYQKPGVLW